MSEVLDGPYLAGALEMLEAESPAKARVIEQYREVAGKFVELWSEIDQRTKLSEWRQDGVGSCRVSPHLFETYLDGAVASTIESLWLSIEEDNPEDGYHNACRFHREDEGCILGDLKSPRCINHVDSKHRQEIQKRFGFKLPNFVALLYQIQVGGMDIRSGNFDLHPELNDAYVAETVERTQALIDHVRTFPVLYPNSDLAE